MIRTLTLSAAVVFAAAPASASVPDFMQPAFENTIVSTYPDGRQAKLWLNPDGTYRGAGRRGKPTSGRWTLKGEEICLKQQRPFSVPFSYCTPVHRGGVGATWTGKAVTGEQVNISLVPGR